MIILRLANINDAKKILDWRNDPVARNNFFNKEIVELDQHLLWLEKVLHDANRSLFIIIDENNIEIGQVRFDVNMDEAEISITLDKNYRGKGYGAESISYSTNNFLKENKKIKRIIARIKPENSVSVNAFKKAGFAEVGGDNSAICMKFEL